MNAATDGVRLNAFREPMAKADESTQTVPTHYHVWVSAQGRRLRPQAGKATSWSAA